ncbi:hypothetical protein ACEPAH_4103 [Sanghuangporus vaninii]
MLSVRSVETRLLDSAVVPVVFSELRFAEYFQFAIVTVLVYDTITCLDKEIKHFWKHPRSLVSIIYFANRYIGLFSAIAYVWLSISDFIELTTGTYWTKDWITINLIDYIFVMRVLALYSKDKLLTILLRSLFAIEAAAMFGILAYVQIFNGTALGVFGTNFAVCQSVRSVKPIFFIFAWGIPLFFECFLMILALYKGASFWSMSQGFSGFNLVKVLLVDQAIYFMIAIFCNVAMIISDTTTDPHVVSKVILGILGSPSLLVVLGARLLVHLKEAGEKGVNEGTSYRVETLGEIEFA